VPISVEQTNKLVRLIAGTDGGTFCDDSSSAHLTYMDHGISVSLNDSP